MGAQTEIVVGDTKKKRGFTLFSCPFYRCLLSTRHVLGIIVLGSLELLTLMEAVK